MKHDSFVLCTYFLQCTAFFLGGGGGVTKQNFLA